MKCRNFLVMIAVFCFAGCATVGLPDDATNAEKRAALCMDATTGLAMADAGIIAAKPGSDEMRYWTAFKTGAQIGVQTYCAVPK